MINEISTAAVMLDIALILVNWSMFILIMEHRQRQKEGLK